MQNLRNRSYYGNFIYIFLLLVQSESHGTVQKHAPLLSIINGLEGHVKHSLNKADEQVLHEK